MDGENTSNTQSESFPEKVDAQVGVSAGNAMIERVGGHESSRKRSASEDAEESSSRPAKRVAELKASSSTSEDEEEFIIPERFSKNGRRKAVSFPLKLMKILSTKENRDVISWLPDGKTFTIRDQATFTSRILPVHFKEAKYTSFTRKLLRWGFQRIKAGTYTHELFQKNKLELVQQMTCKSKAPPPISSSSLSGYGMPGPFSAAHQFPLRQHQSMPFGSPMASREASLPQYSQQDALNAVDMEINRVRRLLEEKRMEAASALPTPMQNLPATQQHIQGHLGMLPMNQPNVPAMGMRPTTSSVASLPNPEEQSTIPASLNIDIEMEVRRRLRLREQGINRGMEAAAMASLRDQGINRGMEAAAMSSLRDQGINRGMEAASMTSLPLPQNMLPLSPQQQQRMMGSRGDAMMGGQWGAAGVNPNIGSGRGPDLGSPGGTRRGGRGGAPPSLP